jgi:hypothetical protein
MERKMYTNANFSNSNTQMDVGIPPATDCHQEAISQLAKHVTTIILAPDGENRLCDSFGDWRNFANEQ